MTATPTLTLARPETGTHSHGSSTDSKNERSPVMSSLPTCGTPSGPKAHRDRLEEPCRDCKDAWNDYMREYRQRRPDVVRTDSQQAALRAKALRRLAALHPADYKRILREVNREARDQYWAERLGSTGGDAA